MNDYQQFKEWQAKQDEPKELEEKVSHHQLSKPTVGKTHNWKQHGTVILCETCETPHGMSVKPGVHMKGIGDNGMPIF